MGEGVVGITPACAGKKDTSTVCQVDHEGSPPRVRGKDFPKGLQFSTPRITPACAGKSQDHNLHWQEPWGSPPRVRGKVGYPPKISCRSRITPACAGKRCRPKQRNSRNQDHPRVCGEKLFAVCVCIALKGSPPRVRGKVKAPGFLTNPAGITPACAGKRLKRSHSIGHFSCILCLFHSVLHRASASGGSRAGPCAPPCLPAQNAVPV